MIKVIIVLTACIWRWRIWLLVQFCIMALICTKVSTVLHIDFVPPVQCQQCKCQYNKKGKKKKKSLITIAKIILTSWIPWKGLGSFQDPWATLWEPLTITILPLMENRNKIIFIIHLYYAIHLPSRSLTLFMKVNALVMEKT